MRGLDGAGGHAGHPQNPRLLPDTVKPRKRAGVAALSKWPPTRALDFWRSMDSPRVAVGGLPAFKSQPHRLGHSAESAPAPVGQAADSWGPARGMLRVLGIAPRAALSGLRTQSLYAVFDHFAEYYWAWSVQSDLRRLGSVTLSPETLTPGGGNPRARTVVYPALDGVRAGLADRMDN
jgi:hypothetical protein